MNESESQNARVPIASSIGAPKRLASTDERGYVATFHHLSIVVGRQRGGVGAHFLAGRLASPPQSQTATSAVHVPRSTMPQIDATNDATTAGASH